MVSHPQQASDLRCRCGSLQVDDVFNLFRVWCDVISREGVAKELYFVFAVLALSFVEGEATFFKPPKDCLKGVIMGTVCLTKHQDVIADVKGSRDAF